MKLIRLFRSYIVNYNFIIDIKNMYNSMNKPRTICINLDRCPERWIKIQEDWSDILKLERYSAIDGSSIGKSGRYAIRETTKLVFSSLLNYSGKYIIIIEDDIYKTKNFSLDIWNSILEFVETNNNWSFITLDPFLCFDNCKLEVFNDIFYKISNFRAAGFIIYNIDFIKNNIQYLLNINKPFDISMTYNNKFVKLTPKKLLVRQYTNKVSTTANRIMDIYDTYWNKTIRILNNIELNNIIKKDFLCISHPRCGTSYISFLLRKFGYNVGHEYIKKCGISSWMLAVDSNNYPWGNIGNDKQRPIYKFKFKDIIHLVRNPYDAIPSIILENKYAPKSYNFRRRFIKSILDIDIPPYKNDGTLSYDIELAILTFIYWNKICELKNPTYIIKIEDAYTSLKIFNKTNIAEDKVNIKCNTTKDKLFGGKKYNKPNINFNNITDDLKNMLKIFCEKYGYLYKE